MNFVKDIKSLCLSDRASERGFRRSEVRLLMGTQNFSLSHARDKKKNIFLNSLPSSKLIFSTISIYRLASLLKIELIEFDLKQTEKKVIG